MVSRNSKAAGALGQQKQQSSRCTWSAGTAKQHGHLVSTNSSRCFRNYSSYKRYLRVFLGFLIINN